ncbi:MAG: hypothetical protein ACWA5U_06760 [bacterium]
MFNVKKGQTKPNQTHQPTTRQVHYDAFGNAIPDLPSVHKQASQTGKSRIVETREVVIDTPPQDKPAVSYQIDLWQPWNTFVHSFKKKRIPKEKSLTPYSSPDSFTEQQTTSPTHTPTANKPVTQSQRDSSIDKPKSPVVLTPEGKMLAPKPQDEPIKPEYVKHVHQAMYEMHRQFEQREEQMEKRFEELSKQHAKQAQKHKKNAPWLMATAIVCSAGGAGYLLFIMQSIQTSMLTMTQDMNSMTTGIEKMVDNTGSISGTMTTMNDSMTHLNGNVTYMNQNMLTMNQNVGQMNNQMQHISHAIQPMGQAAQSVSPMMKMARSFMPF